MIEAVEELEAAKEVKKAEHLITEKILKEVLEAINVYGLPPFLKEKIQNIKEGKNSFVVTSNLDAMRLFSVIFTKIFTSLERKDAWSNSVDPIGFVIGASLSNAESLKEYSLKEQARQQGKTIDNYIGYFHQGLLRLALKDKRGLDELFDNKKGSFDVLHGGGEVGAEIKNKWNTTKGNSREDLYRKLNAAAGVNGKKYFAEILSKPGKNKKNSVKNANGIEICNGEFIYGEAARLQGIEGEDDILKSILENFPAMLWLYCEIFQTNLYLDQLAHNKIDLERLTGEIGIELKKKITPAQKIFLETFIKINDIPAESEAALSYIDQIMIEIKKCSPKKEPFAELKKKSISLLLKRSVLHLGWKQTDILRTSIRGLLQDGDPNLNFFQHNLIGHLFKEK